MRDDIMTNELTSQLYSPGANNVWGTSQAAVPRVNHANKRKKVVWRPCKMTGKQLENGRKHSESDQKTDQTRFENGPKMVRNQKMIRTAAQQMTFFYEGIFAMRFCISKP